MENSNFSEKEILGDALATAKFSTDNYNTFSNECAHENVRTTMIDILNKEHDIQNDLFHLMAAKGYYPTPSAQEEKIAETRQKFQSSVKHASDSML
ncbi:MAG: spore coat protein [Anaerostipes sp.]|nr:spore coat protein [Anaerostipes sp.]